jgi:hypothetical protein
MSSNPYAVKISPHVAPYEVVTDENIAKYQKAAAMFDPSKLPSSLEEQKTLEENSIVYKNYVKSEKLSRLIRTDMERISFDSLLKDGLSDAFDSGNWIIHSFWNDDAYTGQANKGLFDCQLIDNTNFYVADPCETNVQKQPYVIIKTREYVYSLRQKAKKNGVKDYKKIDADKDTEDMAGNHENQSEDGKCTVLYFYQRTEEGLMCTITTRNADIRPEFNTGLSLYPVCIMAWDTRKNCIYGRSPVTEMIPNQLAINKIAALMIITAMNSAFGKVVYDKTRVEKWSNSVASAVGVNGGDVGSVAKILQGVPLPNSVMQFTTFLIGNTQQSMGMNDVMLGNVTPDNKSAFLAILQASSIPIENQKSRLRKMVEDFTRIYIDISRNFITQPRWVEVTNLEGKTYYEVFGKEDFDTPVNVAVDIGVSTLWSDIGSAQTLDNLMMQGKIDTSLYIKGLPVSYRPSNWLDIIEQATAPQPPQQLLPPQGGMTNGIS